MTHEFNNQASQPERREVLRNDTYVARQSNTADDAGGRYAKLTPSNLTGQSQQVPQLPASSPWSSGFDQNVEPELGIDVNALGTEQASIEPVPIPQVVASPTTEVDRTEEPADVSNLASSSVGSPIKRRRY